MGFEFASLLPLQRLVTTERVRWPYRRSNLTYNTIPQHNIYFWFYANSIKHLKKKKINTIFLYLKISIFVKNFIGKFISCYE